ncbi:Protein rarD [Salmonella enterica subsp. enterica]|uniref:Protein rarD n=1 Tax=Salmonella enterica I TaxID=59201 RepID=A0A3S4I0N2_SALET|nr:Protein rarD [Salmonella enterica subsp. enterica]
MPASAILSTRYLFIALGCIFLKEKLSLFQAIAVFSGVCGLTFQIIMLRHFPALALTMGLSFALYGLARKFIHYDVMTSITIENIMGIACLTINFFSLAIPDHLYPLILLSFCMS